VFFRENRESVIQNTATPLRIDFVSVANIHNRIPCLAEGPIAAARPHRAILDSYHSRRIFVAPKETICIWMHTCKTAVIECDVNTTPAVCERQTRTLTTLKRFPESGRSSLAVGYGKP
jgi:hypothetical protein